MYMIAKDRKNTDYPLRTVSLWPAASQLCSVSLDAFCIGSALNEKKKIKLCFCF